MRKCLPHVNYYINKIRMHNTYIEPICLESYLHSFDLFLYHGHIYGFRDDQVVVRVVLPTR